MALLPISTQTDNTARRLTAFVATNAELVASWIHDDREAYWFAPKTVPPITPHDIRAWNIPQHEPLQLVGGNSTFPLAYGELNILNLENSHYWLGHLIVAPERRGCGLGYELTRLLLKRAFSHHGAHQVSLVVFPENKQAIACYRAAGFYQDGYEKHHLPHYLRQVRLLRMVTKQIR